MVIVATHDEVALVPAGELYFLTGVGGLAVIEALKHLKRDTPIFNIGYAGSNCIPIGTRCRIGRVQAYHPAADFRDYEYMLDGDVPCYTAGDFVTATDIKEPCVFDMELAYILALGFTNVTAEKIVSDNLSMEEYEACLKK